MKTATRVGVALFLGVTAAGCAYRPVVDPKRTDMAKYETDLVELPSAGKWGLSPFRFTRREAGAGHGARSPT